MITSPGSTLKEVIICFILLCFFVLGSFFIDFDIIDIAYIGVIFAFIIRYIFIKKKKRKLYQSIV